MHRDDAFAPLVYRLQCFVNIGKPDFKAREGGLNETAEPALLAPGHLAQLRQLVRQSVTFSGQTFPKKKTYSLFHNRTFHTFISKKVDSSNKEFLPVAEFLEKNLLPEVQMKMWGSERDGFGRPPKPEGNYTKRIIYADHATLFFYVFSRVPEPS